MFVINISGIVSAKSLVNKTFLKWFLDHVTFIGPNQYKVPEIIFCDRKCNF